MKQRRRVGILLAFMLLIVASIGYFWVTNARNSRATTATTATAGNTGAIAGTATPFGKGVVTPGTDPVLVGAGDIGECGTGGAEATSKLLGGISGTVIAVGDTAYDKGSAREFQECYDPFWGRYKAVTRPAPGNHEYETKDARPYYDYFGSRAGEVGKGYYSYDLGKWHIIALNSAIPAKEGSDQAKWLRDDLKGDKAVCTLAYWHHPVFSSGEHGNQSEMLDAWRLLYEYKADVVVNGHDHDYERFAPQRPDSTADPLRGIREFVAGTGGAYLRAFRGIVANSETRDSDTWGVLKLTLHPGSYEWEFVPIEGKTFRDGGSGQCVK